MVAGMVAGAYGDGWRTSAVPASWSTPYRAYLVTSDGADDLRRAGCLTPYEVDTLVDDALHLGVGAQLELTVAASAGDPALLWIETWLARASERGVAVDVRFDPRAAGLPTVRSTRRLGEATHAGHDSSASPLQVGSR